MFIHPQIIFVLTFLAFTITFINGHPNAFSWTPKDSEDDVGSRSLSYGDEPTLDDFEELDDEYDFNDLDDDVEDDFFEYNFMHNNKRNPNSVSIRRIFYFLLLPREFKVHLCFQFTLFCGFYYPSSFSKTSSTQFLNKLNCMWLRLEHFLDFQMVSNGYYL